MTQPAGTPDISAMLAQAQRMRQQLLETQRQMAATEVQGRAGDGLVTVTIKGTGEVVAVSIDPKVVDPADINSLQDLIVGAFTDAFGQVTNLARTRLGSLAGGPSSTPGQPES